MMKKTNSPGGISLKQLVLIGIFLLCFLGFALLAARQPGAASVGDIEPDDIPPSDISKTEDSRVQSLLHTNQALVSKVEELQIQLKALKSNAGADPKVPQQTKEPIKSGMEEVKKEDVVTNLGNLIFFQQNYNKYSEIRNKDKFPTLAPDFIPIVIRVFDKHEYLQYAIDYYRKAQKINETIMVISHDGIFPEVFKAVATIDFCQVKEVVHPYSLHTLKDRFPGRDPYLEDIRDAYGNPRPYPHTALKHHYFWHLNHVWDEIFPTHTGDIVLMEEDHVVTSDFYVTLKELVKIRDKECPTECFNVQLHEHGIYANMRPTGDVHDIVNTGMFGNIGISFNRENFIKIKNAAKTFCEFDEYNWDWSTINLQTRDILPRRTIAPVIPRAVHLGKCGTHFTGSGSCDISQVDADKLKAYDAQIKKDNGDIWEKYNMRQGVPFNGHTTGFGGWAHPRDHEHCLSLVKPNPNFADKETPIVNNPQIR